MGGRLSWQRACSRCSRRGASGAGPGGQDHHLHPLPAVSLPPPSLCTRHSGECPVAPVRKQPHLPIPNTWRPLPFPAMQSTCRSSFWWGCILQHCIFVDRTMSPPPSLCCCSVHAGEVWGGAQLHCGDLEPGGHERVHRPQPALHPAARQPAARQAREARGAGGPVWRPRLHGGWVGWVGRRV